MTEDKKIRFALVGCGAVSNKHIDAIARIDNAQIVAVCDPNRTAGEKAARKCNAPWFDCSLKMVASVQADVFSILTPSGCHTNDIIKLAPHVKSILVEKPMALNIRDADNIISVCDDARVQLFVVKQNRYNKPIRLLKKTIADGRFGKLVLGSVRVRWSRDQQYYDTAAWRGTVLGDGGVLANQAAHHIDMLLWLMGDVESVMGMKATRLVDIETEDTASALLKFKSGALGVIEATTATRPVDLEGSISVLGEMGAVEIGGFSMNELKTWNFAQENADDKIAFRMHGKNPNIPAWNLMCYLQDVVAYLNGSDVEIVDGPSGRRTIEVIQAIDYSVKSGKMHEF